ncbi:MAG: glycoside hydrolase domain-containing protein, partial [Candidatus Hydrogenedentales bacterium]
ATLRYEYESQGPNTSGLHVERTIELSSGISAFRVRWRVENRGQSEQWVAPWVRQHLAPGGAISSADRLDVPTFEGIVQPSRTQFLPATRNWAAVTDPAAGETVYGVFNADHLHAFETLYVLEEDVLGFGARFVPRLLAPGDAWETIYWIGAVRGLTHVDFATDEFAAQLDYRAGALELLMSPTRSVYDMELHGVILSGDEKEADLDPKRFSMSPDRLVRASFAWTAPRGVYEFLAQFRAQKKAYQLGRDTAPPHGGIDTAFVVGDPDGVRFEAWTDAPYALDRAPQQLVRTLAATSPATVWFESPLNKIFRDDTVEARGADDPVGSLRLARNERESLQIVLRPPDGRDLRNVTVRVNDLRRTGGGESLPASAIDVYTVGYVPVRIPTHYENPTGDYPDPLVPAESFNAPGGECRPIWLTVFARGNQPPGVYRGVIEIHAADTEPIGLILEVTVLPFTLPQRPMLKTDFGFDAEAAYERALRSGFTGNRTELNRRFLLNALAHRITLRDLVALPVPSQDYAAALAAYESQFKPFFHLFSSVSVSPALFDAGLLAQANALVARNDLGDEAFSQIGRNPAPAAWPSLDQRLVQWNETAPQIAATVAVEGVAPFLPKSGTLWTIHTPIFDTPARIPLLERIGEGGEVWWFVNELPGRPYANFFLDFAAIEHRFLLWQAWGLGVKGLHHRHTNALPLEQNPYESLLDAVPTNGGSYLLYAGAEGPVNSIRWETLRDGIEDYDYLTLLAGRARELKRRGGHDALVERAAAALDLTDIMTNLASFPRDSAVLAHRRNTIGEILAEVSQVLNLP